MEKSYGFLEDDDVIEKDDEVYDEYNYKWYNVMEAYLGYVYDYEYDCSVGLIKKNSMYRQRVIRRKLNVE